MATTPEPENDNARYTEGVLNCTFEELVEALGLSGYRVDMLLLDTKNDTVKIISND